MTSYYCLVHEILHLIEQTKNFGNINSTNAKIYLIEKVSEDSRENECVVTKNKGDHLK